jgi:GYF domain 2
MCAQPADRHWFISRQGKRYGPYTFTALTEAAAKGVITADSNIWRLGWVSWHPASRVPGLIEQSAAEEEASEIEDGSIVPAQDQPAAAPGAPFALQGEAASGTSPRSVRGVAPKRARETAQDQDAAIDDGGAARGTKNNGQDAPGDPDPAAHQDEADDWPLDPPREPRQNQRQDALADAPTHAQPDASKPSDAAIDRPQPERAPDQESAGAELRAVRAVRDEAPVVAERPEVPVVPPQLRDGSANQAPVARPSRWRKAAITAFVLMLFGGIIWGLLASGIIIVVPPRWVYQIAGTLSPASLAPAEPSAEALAPPPAAPPVSAAMSTPQAPPPQSEALSNPPAATGTVPAETDDSGLPAAAAALPAVVALKRTNPEVFEKFKKRLDDSTANAPDDQILALTRTALRKSVKRQLANAGDETLFEITQAYLGYMQALQFSSPESCVALSDESKGASLTVNLEKEYPALFAREMAVLERIASVDPNTAIAPITAEQARPFLDTVFGALRAQPVQSELLGRTKLTPTEFLPYCGLVIAFYEGVLALPADQRMSLLRYLYAAAAADPDDDAHPK